MVAISSNTAFSQGVWKCVEVALVVPVIGRPHCHYGARARAAKHPVTNVKVLPKEGISELSNPVEKSQ